MSKKILDNLCVVEPFTKDLNTELYGRKIARQIDQNQKTVQNKLNSLEEKKALKKRKEGRIKYFTLNKENPVAKTTVIATEIMKFHELIEKSFEVKEIAKDLLQRVDHPVIIYGSFAKEKWNKESDLDLLIIGEKEQKIEEIKKRYNRKIQIMYLTKEEFKQQLKNRTHYMKEILNNHVICQGFEGITTWRFKYE